MRASYSCLLLLECPTSWLWSDENQMDGSLRVCVCVCVCVCVSSQDNRAMNSIAVVCVCVFVCVCAGRICDCIDSSLIVAALRPLDKSPGPSSCGCLCDITYS